MTIMTCITGDNSDLLPIALGLYLAPGKTVADVTYGKGVFWKKVPDGEYVTLFSDLQTGTDFKNLPYENESLDGLILDPPYMHGGATVKKSINDCYKNQNTSHESVIRLYLGGVLEAARCLKKKGRIFIKCQDEIESGKQMMSHVELINIISQIGFKVLDIFVLQQTSVPAMRNDYQLSARKNHSYLIVAEFRR